LQPHFSGKTSPVQRYEQQNSFNEAVNGTTTGPAESYDNPSSLYLGPAQSPYSQRPLPRTPLETYNEHGHHADRVTGLLACWGQLNIIVVKLQWYLR
jgi:hypothetical protein